MARSIRMEYEGAIYHVMARGNRREAIYFDDEDRRFFLCTLGEACGMTGWRVHGWVTPWEMHQLLHSSTETPSDPDLAAAAIERTRGEGNSIAVQSPSGLSTRLERKEPGGGALFALAMTVAFTSMGSILLAEAQSVQTNSKIIVDASATSGPVANGAADGTFESVIAPMLKEYCFRCHGPEKQKGKTRFDTFTKITLEDAELWSLALESVKQGEMPPKDELKRPGAAEVTTFAKWLDATLRSPEFAADAYALLHNPAEGNRISHEKLFDGSITGPSYSPPRMWRKSQSQYDTLMEQLWVIPRLRYDKATSRNNPDLAAYGYTQPFPAMSPEHFGNYSGGVHADEATLRTLMASGAQIAERLTSNKPLYHEFLQPPAAVGIVPVRPDTPAARFLVKPPPRATELEPFIKPDSVPTADQEQAAVSYVIALFLDRPPTKSESERYGELLNRSIRKSGALTAIRGLITAVIVSPEFVYRMELGQGAKDEFGRRLLSPQELAYAIAYALTDSGPDQTLWAAANSGKLTVRSDVEREVRRILGDNRIEKMRPLRFWQEFFGYTRAEAVFKDRENWNRWEVQYLVRDADLIVEHILEKDRDVFAQLLTTDRYFVAYPRIKDPELFDFVIQNTLEETKAQARRQKESGKEIKPPNRDEYNRLWSYTQGFALIPRTVHNTPSYSEMSYIFVYGIEGSSFNWTRDQPIAVPGKRAGILTHPAWLIAHSSNSDNDIVRRGKWIRERLLAGRMPSVPINVNAKVPDEPDHTLRERLRVTRDEYCWRCHKRMDPMGLPFESYNHYGVYITEELVGAKKNKPMPVDATGAITFSTETDLDGPVKDAIELVYKLAKSTRVRQSIIRHAFRFWMGRNEMLSDSPTLLAAERAYLDHEGSFKELLISLLTSDSFLYRK